MTGLREDAAEDENLETISPQDAIIVVMGTTGAGKSSFIADCTQTRAPSIGHALISCTTKVSIHTTRVFERKVHLIDTPGFNDALRSDGDTFQELAYWLAAAHGRGLRLSGIVFLHRITDLRFQGSAKRALATVKAICGKDAFCGITVATTMWNRLAAGEIGKADRRQRQLQEKLLEDELFSGKRLFALSAASTDTQRLVRQVVRNDQRLTLAFQSEFVDEKRLLHETSAGRIIFETLSGSTNATRDSISQCERDMEALLAPLHRTHADVQAAWEERICQEDKEIERFTRECEEYRRLQSDKSEYTPSTGSTPSVDTRCATHTVFTADGSDISPSASMNQQTAAEDMRNQYESVMFRQRHKLDRRKYVAHGRTTTTLGVVGTGLAVGQLVAAVACNVM